MKNRLKQFAKVAALTVWRSPLYARLLLLHDRLAARRARPLPADQRRFSLVVTPTGDGNIGDQAMFDAVLANVSGPLKLISNHPTALQISSEDADRVSVIALPRLIRGMPGIRYADVARFARLSAKAHATYIPGADAIDGGHPHASLARLNAAVIAADLGSITRVQGFSWSDEAPSSVTMIARQLAPNATLLPRDPVSAGRLEAHGVSPITPASDLVFSYDRHEDLPAALQSYIDASHEAGRSIALISMSGLIARRLDLIAEYLRVVEHLRGRGVDIVFLPHVLRKGDNDLAQLDRIVERMGIANDYLVRDQLSPAQIKRLTAQATFSFTGRMHLAIMSLAEGTPAITLATVGKVEGLYRFFGLPELVVQPQPGCAEDVVTAIEAVTINPQQTRSQIRAALEEVRSLSMLNFAPTALHQYGGSE